MTEAEIKHLVYTHCDNLLMGYRNECEHVLTRAYYHDSLCAMSDLISFLGWEPCSWRPWDD